MDPYEILGVPHTASAAEIKAAYRRWSKVAHPDAGGSREAFDRLRTAYDVLGDPKARAHYDATGEIERKQADNAQAMALSMLSAAFDAVIVSLVQQGTDLTKADIVSLIRSQIEKGVANRATERRNAIESRPKWEEIRDRFSVTEGKPNRLASMASAKIAQIDLIERKSAQMDATAEAALQILEDHEYRFDAEVQAVYFHSFSAASSTAWG